MDTLFDLEKEKTAIELLQRYEPVKGYYLAFSGGASSVRKGMDRKRIHQKYYGHCAYCGAEITLKQMQVDHMQSIKNAGTNDEANLMPSCASCNNRKNVLTIEMFRQEIAAQIKRLRRDSGAFRIAERYGLITVNDNAVRFYFE